MKPPQHAARNGDIASIGGGSGSGVSWAAVTPDTPPPVVYGGHPWTQEAELWWTQILSAADDAACIAAGRSLAGYTSKPSSKTRAQEIAGLRWFLFADEPFSLAWVCTQLAAFGCRLDPERIAAELWRIAERGATQTRRRRVVRIVSLRHRVVDVDEITERNTEAQRRRRACQA